MYRSVINLFHKSKTYIYVEHWLDVRFDSLFANLIFVLAYLFLCILTYVLSTAVRQAGACALVTQRALLRSPVGTSFLGDVFSGCFLTCKTNVRKLQARMVPESRLTIIIIINHHSLWAPLT